MGLFSWFQTSEKAVDTGLDLIKDAASGIDMLVFTDEEKSLASLKIMDQALEFNRAIRDENSVRSRARRLLAVLFCVNYICLIDFGFYWWLAQGKEVVTGKDIITLATAAFGTIVLSIIVSYFGYYGIMNIYDKKK